MSIKNKTHKISEEEKQRIHSSLSEWCEENIPNSSGICVGNSLDNMIVIVKGEPAILANFMLKAINTDPSMKSITLSAALADLAVECKKGESDDSNDQSSTIN